LLLTQEVILRLSIAALLGGIVGLERERLEWAAGLRTHMLVSLGSALIMIVSAFGFSDILSSGSQAIVLDPSRVAAQVVSGIGFLGAGTILFFKQQVIRGLTTAASLWTVAGIGLAVGGGLYFAAIFTTVLVIIILGLIKPLERRFFRRHLNRQVILQVDVNAISLYDIQSTLEVGGLSIKEMVVSKSISSESYIYFTFLQSVTTEVLSTAVKNLQELAGVNSVTVKNRIYN
jgi:putative Mg2+ transporter-C (MgtC) family protein